MWQFEFFFFLCKPHSAVLDCSSRDLNDAQQRGSVAARHCRPVTVQRVTPHRGRWGNRHEYTGGRASQFPGKRKKKKEEEWWHWPYIALPLQKRVPSSPVELDFSGSSSTWTSFCHFLSRPSPRRIHGRGHRPHHNTKNCQHRRWTIVSGLT